MIAMMHDVAVVAMGREKTGLRPGKLNFNKRYFYTAIAKQAVRVGRFIDVHFRHQVSTKKEMDFCQK
jgi:hypothetical protein